jgi:hypothetical protein
MGPNFSSGPFFFLTIILNNYNTNLFSIVSKILIQQMETNLNICKNNRMGVNVIKEPYYADLIVGAKLEDVPIEKLKLSIANVRYSHVETEKLEEELEKLILEDPETSYLCDQILAAKTILEPLVINPDYIVIEGNRRLVCLRLLHKDASEGRLDGIPKDHFAKVPCRIVSDKINPRTIDLYLATIHVKGKLPWKLFNRAKHIHHLRFFYGMTYDELAEHTGLGRATISRTLTVYKLVEKYRRMFPGDDQWFRKFTYFEELFRKKDLKERREDSSFLDKFSKWVYEKKFKDHKDVRKLNEILSHPLAKNEFEKHDFATALRVFEMEKPEFADRDFKRINDTITFIRHVSRTRLDEIRSNPAKYKLIVELEAEVKSLLIDLETKKKEISKSME